MKKLKRKKKILKKYKKLQKKNAILLLDNRFR